MPLLHVCKRICVKANTVHLTDSNGAFGISDSIYGVLSIVLQFRSTTTIIDDLVLDCVLKIHPLFKLPLLFPWTAFSRRK
jgi:hypothetical protein